MRNEPSGLDLASLPSLGTEMEPGGKKGVFMQGRQQPARALSCFPCFPHSVGRGNSALRGPTGRKRGTELGRDKANHFSGASGSRSITYFPRATLIIGAPGILLLGVNLCPASIAKDNIPNSSF